MLKQTNPHLPKGVRCMIYTYFDILSLIQVIANLSKTELENLKTCGILDQQRGLKIMWKWFTPKPKELMENYV